MVVVKEEEEEQEQEQEEEEQEEEEKIVLPFTCEALKSALATTPAQKESPQMLIALSSQGRSKVKTYAPMPISSTSLGGREHC